jgi:hypothetical protein
MQQGPSALVESRIQLSIWAAKLAGEARAHGAEPALLTVWPENYRRGALVDVIANYRIAARDARARLFPAGEAWLRAWQCNARLGCTARTASTRAEWGRTSRRSSRTGACSGRRSTRRRFASPARGRRSPGCSRPRPWQRSGGE